MTKIKWWGYLHQQKTLQVKLFFSQLDIDEAKQSPFVVSVHGPWVVNSREEALNELRKELKSMSDNTNTNIIEQQQDTIGELKNEIKICRAIIAEHLEINTQQIEQLIKNKIAVS